METETNSARSLVGTTLDNRYKIVDVIGQGGMSTVYKARHLFLHRDVAVKIMQEHLANNVEGRMRFQREAQAAAALNHPNIVTVTEFGVAEHGEPYMVMDYLEGQSLADVLKERTRCEPAMTLDIFKQVAAALQHAHEKGVLHRDLKPSNVMLVRNQTDNSLQCKVVDLGLARFLPQFGKDQRRLTAAGELVGSPYYMSPEQIRDEELDARSDIYSFGCLMYEALTGVRPFVDTNAITVLSMHLYEPPPPFNSVMHPNRVPPRMESIVSKCLEKNRGNRFQNMRELCFQLETMSDWEDGPSTSVPYNPIDGAKSRAADSIALSSAQLSDLSNAAMSSAAMSSAAMHNPAHTGTIDMNSQYTLRLQQPEFAKNKFLDLLNRILAPLMRTIKPLLNRLSGQPSASISEMRKIKVAGTKVLVVVLGDSKEMIKNAEIDADKYRVYYSNVELRKSLNAQEFLVLLSTETFDIVHLFGTFDKRVIFKDSTGFALRLSDVKRACDFAKTKMLWLASDNNLDWAKSDPIIDIPTCHLVLTGCRGTTFPKFLSTLLARFARGESVKSAWDAYVPHLQYKGSDRVSCHLLPGVNDVSFLP